MSQDLPPPWPSENQNMAQVNNSNQQDQYRAWFIGDKFQKYYQKHFNQITLQKNMSGFNIGAFFLGPIWMFYRKMYAYGLIYIGLMFALGIVLNMLGMPESLNQGASIGLAVALGMLGNTLYKHFVDKKIKLLTQTTSSLDLEDTLKQQGGTNIWIALIVLILAIGLVSLGIYLEGQGY